jgi:hypothetical protein
MTAAAAPLPGWRGGDGNAAYLDKTLLHIPMETYFDESVDWRTIVRLWFRSAVCAFTFFLIMVIISLSSTPDVLGIGALVTFVIFWLVFLVSRLDEPIGEWRVVLEDRAAAAPAVYSAIRGKLAERRMPIRSSEARRTRVPEGTVTNHLILIDGHYQVFVSVFAYGSSLYLGWMMWRSRRGILLVGRFIYDLLAGLAGRLDAIDLMLRTERPRAMREVVHALSREGLHVAVERIAVPDSYGFPEGLPPIEPLPGTSAPAPTSAMTAPRSQPGDPAPWVRQ